MPFQTRTIVLAGLALALFAPAAPAQEPTPADATPARLFSRSTAAGASSSDGSTYNGARWPNGVSMYTAPATASRNSEAHLVGLARQIAAAKSDSEKVKLKEALKASLNQQFDERQKHQEAELAALESKVKSLKEMVARRQENKREIIDEKIKQLERETLGLGW